MLIGLCGLKGSGKDTLANHLVGCHGFVKISFSESLKDIVSQMFGWDREMLDGSTEPDRVWRETVDPFWSKELGILDFSPRYALTFIGTDLFRDVFDKNIWVKVCKKKIVRNLDQGKRIVISDCRFLNEVDLIKNLGGHIGHVYRDLPDWFMNFKDGTIGQDELDRRGIHKSESEWILSKSDFIIMNIFQPQQMFKQFDYIYERFLKLDNQEDVEEVVEGNEKNDNESLDNDNKLCKIDSICKV